MTPQIGGAAARRPSPIAGTEREKTERRTKMGTASEIHPFRNRRGRVTPNLAQVTMETCT